jgi:exopolysaccharide biosynthesis polyprenyl glycosylphosphotransferase
MSTLNYIPPVTTQTAVGPGVGRAAGTATHFWRPAIKARAWAWIDFLTVLAAGLIAVYLHSRIGGIPVVEAQGLPGRTVLISLASIVLFGVYLMVCSQLYGLDPNDLNHSNLHEQCLTVQATVTAALLFCGTLYLLHSYVEPPRGITVNVLLALVMLMIRRATWRHLIRRHYQEGLGTSDVLIVGDGHLAQELRAKLDDLSHMGLQFKGFISPVPAEDLVVRPDVVADLGNCVAVARSLYVNEICFAASLDKSTILSVAEQARTMGINVRVIPNLYDGFVWNGRVEYLGQFPTISLGSRNVPHSAFIVKRLMDIALASLALLVLWPLPALIALVVWLDSRGPILYRAERIGRKGRRFTCLKFRTMVKDADQRHSELAHRNERNGILFKMTNDPRMSRVGAFLRKYSLDEIPQLLNVLRGEMSLVGPRPPIASEVEQYQLAHLRRLDVLPGMTGLWQVEARQDPSFDSYISLDTTYVENWNLLLDIRILARTMRVVLRGTGS